MRHHGYDYFAAFQRMGEHGCEAATMLSEVITHYDPQQLEDYLSSMHTIEASSDRVHHEILKHLAREFVTPIEREDIIELSQELDEVIDVIEDVLIRMYMFNIPYVSQEAVEMSEIIIKCSEALRQALADFENFKKSKEIHPLIVNVNQFEEEGDEVYTRAMRRLCVNCTDPLRVLAWTETYTYMEKCCDACEHVANVMETVMMKNT